MRLRFRPGLDLKPTPKATLKSSVRRNADRTRTRCVSAHPPKLRRIRFRRKGFTLNLFFWNLQRRLAGVASDPVERLADCFSAHEPEFHFPFSGEVHEDEAHQNGE